MMNYTAQHMTEIAVNTRVASVSGALGTVGRVGNLLTLSSNWNGDRNVVIVWDAGHRSIERLFDLRVVANEGPDEIIGKESHA
jgi:hypothetical protein